MINRRIFLKKLIATILLISFPLKILKSGFVLIKRVKYKNRHWILSSKD